MEWHTKEEVYMEGSPRLTPPVFGNFRRAITDTSLGGFDSPKGWQVNTYVVQKMNSVVFKALCREDNVLNNNVAITFRGH